MSDGTFESVWKLSPTKTPMIASGTRIETIVFVWRSRWLSESAFGGIVERGLVDGPDGLRRDAILATGSFAGRG